MYDWHRHLGRKKPSTPNRSRTYDLLVISPDALPLSYWRETRGSLEAAKLVSCDKPSVILRACFFAVVSSVPPLLKCYHQQGLFCHSQNRTPRGIKRMVAWVNVFEILWSVSSLGTFFPKLRNYRWVTQPRWLNSQILNKTLNLRHQLKSLFYKNLIKWNLDITKRFSLPW